MLRFEVKKVFSKTANKIALLILTVALFGVSFLAIGSVNYVDDRGDATSGITAARNLRNVKTQWTGYITEDMLLKVIEKNAEINASDEHLSTDYRENNKAYYKKQGFSDIREMLNMAFSSFKEYDYYRADSVTVEEADELYERRISNLVEWLNTDEVKDTYSEAEKKFLIAKYNELETPFYYKNADGWNALLEYASTIIMLLVLIMGFLVSGIFSNEIHLKADSIFFSTKLGRSKAVASKIGAGFLIVTVIYWVVILLYSVIVLALLGADGAGCVIQTSMSGWKSFYNITYFQEYFLTMLGGYLGSLFILTLSMFVSANNHSTVFAVTIPFILLFVPSLLNKISILSTVLGLLPDQLLQAREAINSFNLYQIGGKVIGAIPIIMILYSILYCILIPALYQVYRKAEIK